jgi:hypothetical protein
MVPDPLSKLVEVEHGQGEYSSRLVSLVDRDPGALVTKIEGYKPAANRAYTSVQVSENQDIELNSDLVYCNQYVRVVSLAQDSCLLRTSSCKPSVIFDMAKYEVRVASNRPLKKGDDVTFFYPSTEWNMQQPFDCNCGSKECLGSVRGAKYLDNATLKKQWLNPHIERLLEKRNNGAL